MGAAPGTPHGCGSVALPCFHLCYSVGCPPPLLNKPLPTFSSHPPFSLHSSSTHPWESPPAQPGQPAVLQDSWASQRTAKAQCHISYITECRFTPQTHKPGRTINTFTFIFSSLASKPTLPMVLLPPPTALRTPEPTRDGTSLQGVKIQS